MSLRTALIWLGGFLAVAYFVIGVAGVVWPGHWDEASALDQILWGVFLIGGGVLLAAGLRLVDALPGRPRFSSRSAGSWARSRSSGRCSRSSSPPRSSC